MQKCDEAKQPAVGGWFFQCNLHKLNSTLPETNISPENRPLEKEIPIEKQPSFLGAMLVLGSVIWLAEKSLYV